MRWILGAAAAGMLLVACADEANEDEAARAVTTEADAEAERYIDTISASMTRGDGDLSLNETQARCFGTAVVDIVSVDALVDAGVTPEDLAEAETLSSLGVELPDDATAKLSDALARCDVVEALEAATVSGFSDEFGADLPSDGATCVADAMDVEEVADAWAAAFVDGSEDDLAALMGAAVAACPDVAITAILAEAPTDLTAEAEACVRTFMRDNARLAADAFSSQDLSAAEEFGTQLAAACPALAAG